jgi:hypothetical protein
LAWSYSIDVSTEPPCEPTFAGDDAPFPAAPVIVIVSGREAILAYARMLEEFAAINGQLAAMHGLKLTLHHEYAVRKTPHLVCLVSQHHCTQLLSIETMLGCVLFFEYRIGFWNTGMIATGDSSGVRTVFGAAGHRARIAALAASALLRRARIVLVSFKQDPSGIAGITFPETISGSWALQVREVRDHLVLQRSFDSTLATLGKRTRTHLRYYRKRLAEEMPYDFIPNAPDYIHHRELDQLNSSSLEPVSSKTFDLQYRTAAELPGGFVCGLRAKDGRWLSLAGGWRQNTTTIVQWQVNAAGFEKFSLGTAFRAILIEQEISLGITRLCFFGSTSHPMHHSFPHEHVADLVLRRRSLLATTMVRCTPIVVERVHSVASRGNFLADVLRNRGLKWFPFSIPPKD